MLSILDVFRIGIGPSSSHTVGPMRIARRFLAELDSAAMPLEGLRLRIFLRGSLAFTGEGHGTPRATILGLLGFEPATIDLDQADAALSDIFHHHTLRPSHRGQLQFDPNADVVLDFETAADLHPNEMECVLTNSAGDPVFSSVYYSTGGGFIASKRQLQTPIENDLVPAGSAVPFEFGSAAELLDHCDRNALNIRDIILLNEDAKRPRPETEAALSEIVSAMMSCIDRGLRTEGTLPGSLAVQRRAPTLWQKLNAQPQANEKEQLFDWLNAYAMAVNEENAAGGKVVTAPTNGAAGIIPAILRHYCSDSSNPKHNVETFLATAGGIGLLYKQRASISGAEMGCQGEVGVACSMAAGGLAAVWGATPLQVAQAAEIGMEHNLGLTCDPVGGLVQIPCIERNALGAVKAVNAARLALHSTGPMKVSLDQVIETMRQTGLDMSSKYKETSQGGLAVNVVEC
ncbi:MAG: L-serine ammonia-lyase [Pseudomonadota bacterium]